MKIHLTKGAKITIEQYNEVINRNEHLAATVVKIDDKKAILEAENGIYFKIYCRFSVGDNFEILVDYGE